MACYNKCLYCLSVESGCMVLSIINLFISITCIITTTLLFEFDHGHVEIVNDKKAHHEPHLLSYLGINKMSSNAILITIQVFSITGILFSIFLMVGIRKVKPNLLLSYFVFGIFQVFALFLGAILELIHLFWVVAMFQLIISVFYIHGLTVVHLAYESMIQGSYGSPPHDLLEELIYDEDEEVVAV